MRRKLIDAIWEYSKEEYETPESMLELAKMSEEELVNTLINILEYYADK
jgi:hypothetical protein